MGSGKFTENIYRQIQSVSEMYMQANILVYNQIFECMCSVPENTDVFSEAVSVLRWPDAYLGLTTMGQNMSVPHLQRALRLALAAGQMGGTPGGACVTAELMVHPGYPSHPQEGGCGDGPDDFSQSPERQHELSVLRDPSVAALLSQEKVQVCAFKDL